VSFLLDVPSSWLIERADLVLRSFRGTPPGINKFSNLDICHKRMCIQPVSHEHPMFFSNISSFSSPIKHCHTAAAAFATDTAINYQAIIFNNRDQELIKKTIPCLMIKGFWQIK
jgi:hypothetical protein